MYGNPAAPLSQVSCSELGHESVPFSTGIGLTLLATLAFRVCPIWCFSIGINPGYFTVKYSAAIIALPTCGIETQAIGILVSAITIFTGNTLGTPQ